uniref:hypothetical protein n=1 Tax=Paractinoplanes polyasparticus TaxID=2856853 RepID=UPI001C84AD4A|nr:hypothetical protein [Actinoplanes polyasparticus]
MAAIRDEHPVPSAEDTGTLPPEFEPTTPPEPGSEQDDRPGDPRSELPEDGEAPEPPWTPAEAGPVLSPSEDPPEQTSVRSDQAFPTEEPPHETTGTDGPREQPLTAEGNEPHLSTIDERPHPGSEKPSVSTDEADSGRDATEAPSADSFAEATTQGTIGGARERPPADGPAGSDSRAAIRDAWRSAQEARLEQAVGRLPEPVETPPTRPADSDELTAVDTPVAASEIDQGDLIREDPDMAEAVAEVLRQFGSAMGRLPGYESLGQAVQHAGNGIGMVDAWRANRHLGAAEAINAGLDALVDALGGGKDMNVPTVMDPLKDRIRAIVGARFPAPGDAYGQPPLIRSNRRRRDESQP